MLEGNLNFVPNMSQELRILIKSTLKSSISYHVLMKINVTLDQAATKVPSDNSANAAECDFV